MAELSRGDLADSSRARDDPTKRFKRAVQRVIFVNRFKSPGDEDAADGRLPSKGSAAAIGIGGANGSVTAERGHGKLASVAASVIGKGRSNKRSRAGKSVDAYIKNLVDLYDYSQNREVDDRINLEKLPWHVIDPDSPLKTAWDIMTLVLVVYFAFMVPYRIGFDVPLNEGEQLLDTISDVIFIVDLIVSFRTAFKQDGIVIYDSKRMAVRYLKSWFAIDLLASFPIGWFVSGAETKVNKLFRMLRLFKLFRILRLLKLFPRVMAIVETAIKFNPSLLRFIRSFAILFIIWHNIGCIYYFVAREEYGGVLDCKDPGQAAPGDPVGRGKCYVNHCVCSDGAGANDIQSVTGTVPGWYDPRNPDIWVPHYTLASASLQTQYLQSLFWAVEVTTGIGDDISPKSDTEVIFTTVMAVLGLVVYAVIIGSASSALQNLDADAAVRREVLESATNFMRARNVPLFFQKIIKDYYDHMWQSPRDADEVFADLPASLRARLSIVINRDLVDRIPLLQLIPAEVYIRTVHRLEKATFLPGEFVLRQGQVGDSILLIDRGRVDAVLPNGRTVFMTLYPGDFFGESSLLYGTLRDASFRAVDYLDVFIMDKSTFEELSVSAPGFLTEVRRVDSQRQSTRLRLELENTLGVTAATPDVVDDDDTMHRSSSKTSPAWGKGREAKGRKPTRATRACCSQCGSGCWPRTCCGSERIAPRAGPGAVTTKRPMPLRGDAGAGVSRGGHDPDAGGMGGVVSASSLSSETEAPEGADSKFVSSKPSFVYVRSASQGDPKWADGSMSKTPFDTGPSSAAASRRDLGLGKDLSEEHGSELPGATLKQAPEPAQRSVIGHEPTAQQERGASMPRRPSQASHAVSASAQAALQVQRSTHGLPGSSSMPKSLRVDATASVEKGREQSPQLQRADSLLATVRRLGWQESNDATKASTMASPAHGATREDVEEHTGEDEVADLFLRALRRNKPALH